MHENYYEQKLEPTRYPVKCEKESNVLVNANGILKDKSTPTEMTFGD